MSSKKILIISIAAFILLLLGFVFVKYSQNNTQKSINLVPSPVQSSPTPTAISKPAPVTITTIQGVITNINSSSLTLDSSGKSQSFSIAGTKDFQKVTSGTVEAGDAKTVPSSLNELKIGQQVLIIHNIGSNLAIAVYIIK